MLEGQLTTLEKDSRYAGSPFGSNSDPNHHLSANVSFC